jgi:hypothetical protein
MYVPRVPDQSLAEWRLEHDMVRLVGFYATFVLWMLKLSSLHEIIQATTGISLRIMYIVVPPAALAVVLSGGVARVLRHRAAWCWIAFVICLAAALPFSSWFGGSLQALYRYVRTEFLMLFLLGGTIATWKECRLLLSGAVFAVMVPTIFSLRSGGDGMGGRLAMDFRGSIANPNDLAAHILLCVPLLLLAISRPKANFAFRAFAFAIVPVAMYAILRTASRGALVAIVIGVIVLFFKATARQRIVAVLLVPLILGGALMLMPSQTLRRLTSFSHGADSELEAVQSAESRRYLFMKSLEFTARYPLSGVGMDQFATVEGKLSRDEGRRGNWHATHNAYTQVSSENGMPAAIAYLAAIFATFGILRRTAAAARANGLTEISIATSCTMLSMTVFLVAIVFLSLAYTFYLPALCGLAIGMSRACKTEISRHNGGLRLKVPDPKR